MKISPHEYEALLRQDPYAFLERAFYELHADAEFQSNWHLELITSALEDCRTGKNRRLIVTLPPRSLKSIAVSVAFPAFWLGHNPTARIIAASYAQDLSDKHARDCRSIMQSPWYSRIFATRLSNNKASTSEFTTTKGGFRMSTSVGGVLTGRGADLLILDDALRAGDAVSDAQRNAANEWFSRTLYSRLDNKQKGVIIIVQQRLHEDDLVGHVRQYEDWKKIRFPAIAEEDEEHVIVSPYGRRTVKRRTGEALHPARESLHDLENLRRSMGAWNFASQYQQSPAPLGGGLIKREWFKFYSEKPEKFDRIIQSWDTANKASQLANFSACTTWGLKDKDIYLLNVYRKRIEFPDLVRAVEEQLQQFGPSVVLVEEAASGVQLLQQLREKRIYTLKAVKPEKDKVVRMHARTAIIENGFVHLPREAHWLEDYLHELTMFPKGRYSDQVDSSAQALAWIADAGRPEDFMRFMVDQARGLRGKEKPPEMVRLRAPAGSGGCYGSSGLCPVQADGTVLVPDQDVAGLLRAGFTGV